MSDTYCGKNCNECSYREELNCNGCKFGPGRETSEECSLASCCRTKRHETCATCMDKSNCYNYLNRNKIPVQRINDRKEKIEKDKELTPKAEVLKKWIDILFFVVIFSIVFDFVTGSKIFSENDILSTIVYFCDCVFAIAYAACLLCMGKICKEYYFAAVLILLTQLEQVVYNYFTVELSLNYMVTELSLKYVVARLFVVIITYLLTEYFEIKAHSEAVSEFNLSMAGNWKRLWKAYIVLFVVLLVVAIGVYVGAVSVLVFMIILLGIYVLRVIKVVYIRQSYNIYFQYLKMREFDRRSVLR